MADDFTSTTSTTGTLLPGGQATGAFETSLDSDWFKITLTANNVYRFELSGSGQFSGYNSNLSIYDSTGSYLAPASTSDYSSSALYGVYKPATSGTYYIAARDNSYSISNPVSYTLKASAGEVDDAGDTFATAKVATLGQAIKGTFESAQDIDRYKLTLEAGTSYTVTTVWTESAGTYSNNALRIENSAGDIIATGYTYSYDGKLSFTTTTAGDYYLAAYADSRARTASTSYTLTPVKAADDYVATTATTGVLTPSVTLDGSLETTYDRDWFSAKLTAGTTYWFTLGSVSSTGSGASMLSYNSTIRLLDSTGKEISTLSASSSYGASKIILPYTAASTDTYYVEVKETSGGIGKYTIGASYGVADDYTNDLAKAAMAEVNKKWTGKLELPQDRDVVKIAVTKGKTYLFEVNSVAPADNASLDLQAAKSPDYYYSNLLTDYPKSGTTEYKVYRADYTGELYLTAYNPKAAGTTGYSVNIIEAPADDYGDDAATAGTLPINGKVTGALDYTGDVDWFKVTLQYGAKYAFSLHGAGTGEGTLVTGDGGATLQVRTAYSDYYYPNLQSAGAGNYTLKTDAAGDYYIGVSKSNYYSGYGTPTNDGMGTYTLRATALSTDFTPPKVTKVASASGATTLNPFEDIYVTFDEAVNVSGTAIRLKNALGEYVDSYSSSVTMLSNGTVLKLNPYNNLKPGAKYFVEIVSDAITDLAGNKYSGTPLVAFNTVAPVEKGGAGNDYLVGLAAATVLDGGAGVDTAIYAQQRTYYTIGRGAEETRVYTNNNPAQADILKGVERLLFSDTAVALDTDGTGGQAYRLYQAAFNRTPDKSGLGFWMAMLDNGVSLHDAAQSFIGSDEFITKYGANTSDAVFVDTLYQNVLHRAGEAGGVAFWNSMLSKGVPRADVLAAFSESPENQAAVIQVIGNGFEYTPYG